jgi:hypothetical protein
MWQELSQLTRQQFISETRDKLSEITPCFIPCHTNTMSRSSKRPWPDPAITTTSAAWMSWRDCDTRPGWKNWTWGWTLWRAQSQTTVSSSSTCFLTFKSLVWAKNFHYSLSSMVWGMSVWLCVLVVTAWPSKARYGACLCGCACCHILGCICYFLIFKS